MDHRITALVPLFLPLAALLGACSSTSEPPLTNASALTAPGLGTAEGFAVLGGSTVTNTGATTVVGNLGVHPGTSVTGFPPGIQTGGSMFEADAVALQGQNDVKIAYDLLASNPCTLDLSGTDLGGLTLTEGVYCFSSSAQLTGKLTLDAKGKPNPIFIFKTVSTLTTASNASVVMINGGSYCSVFWQVGSSATVGTNTVFVGSILALTSISLQTGASVDGRALARNGSVTMDDNHVALSSCAPADAGASDALAVDSSPIDSGSSGDSASVSESGAVDSGTGDSGSAGETAGDTSVDFDSGCQEPESDCY